MYKRPGLIPVVKMMMKYMCIGNKVGDIATFSIVCMQFKYRRAYEATNGSIKYKYEYTKQIFYYIVITVTRICYELRAKTVKIK